MRSACLGLVLGLAVSPMAPAQDGPDRMQHVDMLIAASSAAAFGQTLQALASAMELAPQRAPGLQTRQALHTLCEHSFPVDSMEGYLQSAFNGRYNPTQFDGAIEWFRSPLGRKVAGAERASASLKGPERQEVREKVRSQWSSSRRLLLLERLDGNLGLGAQHETYALALLEDLLAFPVNPSRSDEELQRMLLQASDRMASRLRDSLMLDRKMTYRSLSNDEIQGYNEFLESSAGRWYVEMVREALENAFLNGRQRFIAGAATLPASARNAYRP